MPTATYIALANLTLTATDSEIVFSSIPATYRDLVLIFAGDGSVDGTSISIRLNSDTGNNYNRVFMVGNGSTASSGSNANVSSMDLHQFANGRIVNFICNIMDYSATDKHKTLLTRDSDAGRQAGARAFRWASTNAVTSISVYCTGANFNIGSSFALYGIVS